MSFMTAWGDIDQSLVKALGEPITLPDGHEVNGVFEVPANEGGLGNLSMDYRSPVVTLTTNDADPLKKGDVITVRGAGYTVSKMLATGDGVTLVQLAERQSDPDTGSWK